MKRASHGHQHYDLYAEYHEQDSEIRVLLGKCGLKEATAELSVRPSFNRCRRAAEKIGRLCHKGYLTNEVHRFFYDAVRQHFSDSRTARHCLEKLVVPLLNWIIRHGFPPELFVIGENPSFTSMENFERRCQDVLWSYAQVLAEIAFPFEERQAATWEPGPISLEWPYRSSFSSLFGRLVDPVFLSNIRRLPTFNYLDLRRQHLSDLGYGVSSSRPFIIWGSLSLLGCDLREAQVFATSLVSAKLDHSNLDGAIFSHTDLSDASICNVSLKNVLFAHVYGSGADFSFSNLTGARIAESVFEGARFHFARLENVELRNITKLEHILISRTPVESELNLPVPRNRFTESRFQNSVISHTDFSNSDLTRTIFDEVSLESSDLSLCDVGGASFNLKSCVNVSVSPSFFSRATNWKHHQFDVMPTDMTCSPEGPSVDMRVRHQETDDEEEPVYRGADDRRAA